VIAEIHGSHSDADSFRFPVEEASRSHMCKLVGAYRCAPHDHRAKKERGSSSRASLFFR
jgi:hypothetical protein